MYLWLHIQSLVDVVTVLVRRALTVQATSVAIDSAATHTVGTPLINLKFFYSVGM